MKHILILGALCLLFSSCGSNIISGQNDASKNLVESYNSVPLKYRNGESFNVCIASNIQYCSEQAIQQYANKERDTLACDDLINEDLQQQCKDSIVSLKARDDNNVEICNDISGNEIVSCRYSILSQMAIQELDTNICKKIGIDDDGNTEIKLLYDNAVKNCRNTVLTNTAIQKQNEKLCNRITTRDIRNSCVEQVTDYKTLIENTQDEK